MKIEAKCCPPIYCYNSIETSRIAQVITPVKSDLNSDSCKSKPKTNPLIRISDKEIKNVKVMPDEDKKVKENKNKSDYSGPVVLKCAVMNPGGINKMKSRVIENIVKLNDLDIVIVSETNASGTDIPSIGSGMTAFNRNRNTEGICKGGICVFINSEISPHAVILDKGDTEDGDEFISVKINCFSPPVIVCGLYGRQENGPRAEVREGWKRIFSYVDNYKKTGCMTILAGDWNCALGQNLGMSSNDSFVSPGGKVVLEEIAYGGWTLINSLTQEDAKTHYDRTSGTERALDFAITNYPDTVKFVTTDPSRNMTPYIVMMKGKVPVGRKYTDHRTLAFTVEVTKVKTKMEKPPIRFIKTNESIARFADLTDNLAAEILPKILDRTISTESAMKQVDRGLLKAKYSAHKAMRPKSKKKKELLDDKDIFWKNTEDLEKELDNIKDLKVNNQIFNIRKQKILKDRRQELSAMLNKKTGQIVSDKDSIIDLIMDHNQVLLSRNQHPPDYQELFQLKVKLMEIIQAGEISEFDTLTWEEFEEIVTRIKKKSKPMFKDFIESGPEFKYLIFQIVKMIYETESIPESFLVTTLVALFKKGDPRDVNNYRFLHLKGPVPRILELAIYLKLEDTFDTYTSENQLGGMKASSTSEHLALTMSLVNDLEKKKSGAVITCADVRKCFDNAWLSDMNWFLVKNQADIKATRMYQKLTGVNNLTVQGAKESFLITDGIGQGGIGAARSTSGGSSEVLERNMETHVNPIIYNGVNATCDEFVDDTKMTDYDSKGAKVSGNIITASLDELAMLAHPDKTVQIVVGHQDYIIAMKEELEKNPTFIQGFKVGVKDSEKYLGFQLKSGGVKEMIDFNIKDKKKKMGPVAQDIRKLTRDQKTMRVGGLKAACLMVQARGVPILTYGTEAWLNVSKEQYGGMEAIFKKLLTKVLSLPKSTTYEALLHEAGNFHIEMWMDALKLKFYNKLIHVKHEGRLYRVIREEIIQKIEGGFVSDVKNLCLKYKLPDITLHYIRPCDINEAAKYWSRERIWQTLITVKTLPMVPGVTVTRKVIHEHHTYDVMKARAISCYNTANLVFKTTCPHMFRTRDQGDKSCLFPQCDGYDSYVHVRYHCRWYKTKYISTGHAVEDNANFLVKLNAERISRFKSVLIIPAPPL